MPRASTVAALVAFTAGAVAAASSQAATRHAIAVRTVATSRGDSSLVIYAPRDGQDAPGKARPLALVLSGEGGWRAFDDLLAGWLADDGYWTGGFDAMAYFGQPQDDRNAFARDLRAHVAALAGAAGRPATSPVVLVGFSFGADLAPWVAGASGWSPGSIAALVMLGPDETGSTQFRWMEMLGVSRPAEHVFDVASALRTVDAIPKVFIHGGSDPKSSAPLLAAAAAAPKEVVVIPGADHHFSGHEAGLREALLAALARALSRSAQP